MRSKVRNAWFSLIAVSVVSSAAMIPIGVGDLAHDRTRVEVRAGKCSRNKALVQPTKNASKTPRLFRWIL